MTTVIEHLQDPVVLALILGSALAIFFVAGLLRGDRNGSGVKASKSFADVSKGLQREQQQTDAPAADDGKVLSASVFRPFQVLKVTQISHNTKLIRFELPADKSLGLTIGRHITLRAEVDGAKVMRAYTPTSRIDQTGYFDLLIKSYEYGKLSSFLHTIRPGQVVEVRGPVGRFKYAPNTYPRIGLIAGGTGLTPCLQVMRTILQCPDYSEDRTCFTLFFQNRCEEDILLQEELETLRQKYPQRVTVVYFLSNAAGDVFGRKQAAASAAAEIRGYIQQQHVDQQLAANICPLVGLCGPSGFNEAMKKLLIQAGHNESSLYVW